MVSYLGDAFFNVGFIWIALVISNNPGIAGTVVAVYGLPPVLLGPFVGALADSLNKRWIVIIGDGIRGIILLGVYGLWARGSLTIGGLPATALVLSLCDIMYKPSLRVLVPTKELQSANSSIQGSQQFASIVGAGLAGLLVAMVNPGLTVMVDALTQVRRPSLGSIMSDTGAGIRFCFGTTGLFTIMLLMFGMNLFLSPVNVIFPVYSRDTIGAGAEGYGVLVSILGVGMVLGSVVTGTVGKRLSHGWSVTVGIVGMALSFVGLAFAPGLLLAVAATVLLGAAVPLVQVPLITELQQEVQPTVRGVSSQPYLH